MSATRKTFLCVFRALSPNGFLPAASLDVALTVAAFDCPVVLWFVDDAVRALDEDHPGRVALQDTLILYGLDGSEGIFAESESVRRLGTRLVPEGLALSRPAALFQEHARCAEVVLSL